MGDSLLQNHLKSFVSCLKSILFHQTNSQKMLEEARTFFTQEEQENIVCAIQNAEMMTSGEIRVHIENQCPENILDRAAGIFATLEMQETQLRNGVLFYLAVQDHCFAVLGDLGINTKVDDCFWQDVVALIEAHFRQGNFADGMIEGITLAGEKLQEHFPYDVDDVNELSDEISFGNPNEKSNDISFGNF